MCFAEKRWVQRLGVLVAGVMVALLAGGALAQDGDQDAGSGQTLPLVEWDLLRHTIYKPPLVVVWPPDLLVFDGEQVRLEGYLMPRFNYQDPGDLLLSALHPRSIFCGPTDMTALVEVTYPGFTPEQWPNLPVEVSGTFHISKSPGNLFYLFHLRADSMRVLRRWEQEFPGAVEELRQAREEGQ